MKRHAKSMAFDMIWFVAGLLVYVISCVLYKESETHVFGLMSGLITWSAGIISHILLETKYDLEKLLEKPDISMIIDKDEILLEGKRFAERASGRMYWYNVPLGRLIEDKEFDYFLLSALENKKLGDNSIVFVLDNNRKEELSYFWEFVKQKIEKTGHMSKVYSPFWENMDDIKYGFKFIDYVKNGDNVCEAHLMIYGEPFMKKAKFHEKAIWVPQVLFELKPKNKIIERLLNRLEEYKVA